MTALDLKKVDKDLYQPGTSPALIDVPAMRFITVEGRGDPAAPAYADAIALLYALSFGIKMSKKGPAAPVGYVDYVVAPLEGLWWFDDEMPAWPATVEGRKDDFRWLAMIRQPDFVTAEVVAAAAQEVARKRPDLDVASARFEELTEGLCAQAMHIGPYDAEPATVARLDDFIVASGHRTDMAGRRQHHEIYLGDPRRTEPAKLRTVIRHPVAAV